MRHCSSFTYARLIWNGGNLAIEWAIGCVSHVFASALVLTAIATLALAVTNWSKVSKFLAEAGGQANARVLS